jgi:hypothetical protein
MIDKVDIEQFAELVSAKMGARVSEEMSVWTGEELMLGGFKNLNPKEYYELPVHVYEHFDHRQNIIDAYEKKRKHGVEIYLKNHLPERVVTKLLEML